MGGCGSGISVSGMTAPPSRQVYVLSESGVMTHSKLPIPLRLRSVELRGLRVLRHLNGERLHCCTYIYRRKHVVTYLSLPITLKNEVSVFRLHSRFYSQVVRLLYLLQAFLEPNLRRCRCFNKIYFEPPVFHYVETAF